MPETSVIIPIYKSARYLRPALESLCAQTVFGFAASHSEREDPFEVLLIVDGECEDFQGQLPGEIRPCLKILSMPHGGVSAARNFGIRSSTASKYIAFLDSDDLWLPTKLEKQIALLERSGAGLVYANSYWIDKTGQVLSRTQREQYGRLPSGRIAQDMMVRDYIITSSMILKKEVIEHVGSFDENLEVCEDWEFKIRVSKTYDVLSIQEPLIYYRLHYGGSHYKCQAMLECGHRVFDLHADSALSPESRNGKRSALKANVSLNLAGSWLYIDQTAQARKYLSESFKWNKKNPRLYIMFIMSIFPKWIRDLLLKLRDSFTFLP